MNSNIATLQNMCRTCMIKFSKRKKKSDICKIPNGYKKEDASIREILQFVQPQIKIEMNDNLPTLMCYDCIETLLKVYEFIKMYRNTDKKFRDMINEINKVNSTETDVNALKDSLEIVVENNLPEKTFEKETNIESLEKYNYEYEINELTIEKMGNEEESDWPEFDDESLGEMSEIGSDNEPNPFEDDSADEWLPKMSENMATNSNKNITVNIGGMHFASEKKPHTNSIKGIESVEGHELPVENGSIKCKKCDEILENVKLWQQHMRNHLLEKIPAKQIKKKTIKKQKFYECEHCKKEFTDRSRFKSHILIHMEPSFLCIECGKKFKTGSSLHTHMLRHKGEKNFHCQQCPRKFNCSSGLYSHMLRHSKEKPHVCDVCGKGFNCRYDLKQHKLYHNGVKNFQCDQCDMKFISKEKLTVHIRTHTGEKPYRCKYCDKAYAQSTDCVKHLRLHIGDNVYQCELCPLRFPKTRDVREHFATHKGDDEVTRARNLKARLEEQRNWEIKLGIKSS